MTEPVGWEHEDGSVCGHGLDPKSVHPHPDWEIDPLVPVLSERARCYAGQPLVRYTAETTSADLPGGYPRLEGDNIVRLWRYK